LKKAREGGDTFLLLELGDAIVGAGEHAKIKMQFFSRALTHMSYDVVGMGDMEARYVKESGAKSPFGQNIPLISANAVDFQTGELLGDAPFVIKETPAGLRVGIISVISESLVHPVLQEKIGVRLIPAQEAIQKYIGDLDRQSDIIVLLSHTGLESARALASKFPNIDVILVGHSGGRQMESFEKVGNTIIMVTRATGKWLGKLVLDITPEKRISGASGEYVAMGSECGEDPEMLKLVEEHDADLNRYYSSLHAAPASSAPTIPQRYEPREPEPFVSALKCRECHRSQYEAWVQTDHAKAFETLRREHKENDPACASCHMTGFATDLRIQPSMNSRFWGVQCEACHGPGVRHVRKPGKGYGVVLESTCRQCHDADRGKNFNFRRDREKVALCKTAGQANAGAE